MRGFTRHARRCALAVFVAAAALSCAQSGPATRQAPIVERTPPPTRVARAPAPQPQPPAATYAEAPPRAPPDPVPAVTAPLAEPADVEASAPAAGPGAMPAPRAGRPPPAPTDLIALILPLDTPTYGRAADAVRAGFLAAAEAANAKDRCIVIGHKEDGVLAAFDEAKRRGVRVIVGPLLRDDLRTLAIADAEIPWTIALNQLDDPTTLPPAAYTFALAVEADGRAIARRAQFDGVRSIDVIAGDPPIVKRLAGAFATAWVAGGGAAPGAYHFDAGPDALTGLRRNLAKAVPDAVVLAVDGNQAALLKSFVGAVPAYASGLVFERPADAVVRDLNDLRIVEVPWLVTPDAPELAPFPRRDFGSASLERLYALGIDAFRVAQAFGDEPPERFELEGATGFVRLEPGRQFVREGRIATYRDGKLVPLEPTPR